MAADALLREPPRKLAKLAAVDSASFAAPAVVDDDSFFQQYLRLLPRQDDLYSRSVARLWPARSWTLDPVGGCFVCSLPPRVWTVNVDVVERLRQQFPERGADLVAHPAQWVRDREQQLLQFMDQGRAFVLTEPQFCAIYGDNALPHDARAERKATAAATAAAVAASAAPSSVSAASPAHPAALPVQFLPLPAAELASEGLDRKVLAAVLPMIEAVRGGLEPDSAGVRSVLVDGHRKGRFAALMASLQRLVSQRLLTTEDVHMVMDAWELADFDQRAGRRLRELSRAAAPAARAPRPSRARACGPDAAVVAAPGQPDAQQPRRRHRRLRKFVDPEVPAMQEEAKALGFDLVRVPCVLTACRECKQQRLTDKRASSGLRGQFACGSDIQINQDVLCGQPDELEQESAWVWQEPARVIRER